MSNGSKERPESDQRHILGAFAGVVELETHNLARVPGHIWQQCYNELQWDDLVRESLAPQFARRTAPGSRVWLRLRTRVGRSGELHQVLRGHEGTVETCAVMPDGSSVVSGDGFGEIRIWDSRTGRTRLTLEGHEGTVHECAVGPGGAYVISAGMDGTLRTWDPTTGVELERVANEERPILCCAVAPDGSCIVSGSADGSVTIWERRESWEPRRLEGHTNAVTACAVSPNGRFIVSGQQEREAEWMWERTPLRVWNRETGRLIHVLKGHRGSISDCAISPDGSRVLSAGEDSKLMIWNLRSGRRRRVVKWVKRGEARWYKKVRQKILSCAFAPDGSLFIAGSAYGLVGLWDSSGKELRVFSGHQHQVQACAVSPDGSFVVSASWDETLMMWSLEPGEEPTARSAHTDSVRACAIAPDGSFLVSGSHDRTLKIREPETAEPRITMQAGPIAFCSVSPDSSYIVSGGGYGSGVLKVWDAQEGREIDSPTKRERLGSEMLGCTISPDGSLVASLHHDRMATEEAYKLRLWDAVSGDSLPLPTPEVPPPSFFQEPQAPLDEFVMLYGCTVGPDGPRLVVKTFNGAIVVMDTASGRRVVIPEAGADRQVLTIADQEANARALKKLGDVNGCAVAPDGSYVVTASGNTRLKIWDTRTGQEV